MPNVSSRGRGRRTMNEINMVPFIDVMLVLLIIFMVTAPMISTGTINVPRAGKSSQPPETYLSVEMKQPGSLTLTRIVKGQASEKLAEGLDEQALLAAIETQVEANPEVAVSISADQELKYKDVMALMKTIRGSGVERVALTVQGQ